jgi:GNAT superfamily N-acetyltransferase
VIPVRRLEPGDVPTCESILRALPDWFGIEASNVAYVRSLSELPGLVALDGEEVVGFLAVRRHNPSTSEVHVMGVRADRHRSGIGRALIVRAEQELLAPTTRLLEVKTLGPSHPDPFYARTRAFYSALGFLPLEETNLWGDDQPCLILVKPLARGVVSA